MRGLEGDDRREVEPHAAGVAGLHSPTTAITDYPAVARAFRDDLEAGGGSGFLGGPVTAIGVGADGVRVRAGEERQFDRLVVCAGVYSDRLARLARGEAEPVSVPVRGAVQPV